MTNQQKSILLAYYPELKTWIEEREKNASNVIVDSVIMALLNKIEIAKGEKGDVGYTPVKGKDYWTDEEIKSVIENATPVKGIHYDDGEDGKDYVLTNKDKKEIANLINVPIVEKVIEKIEVIKEVERDIDVSMVKDAVSKNELETESKKILAGMAKVDGRVKAIDMRWHGGLGFVTTDGTLSGRGTASSPLSVANASTTLANVSALSLTTPNSLYTMTSTIPVEFKRSAGDSLLYLDETNGRVGIGTTTPVGLFDIYSGATPIFSVGSTGQYNFGKGTFLDSSSNVSQVLYTNYILATNKSFDAGANDSMKVTLDNTSGASNILFTRASGTSGTPNFIKKVSFDMVNGYIGIGNLTPAYQLDILGANITTVNIAANGANNARLFLTSGSANKSIINMASGAESLIFQTDGGAGNSIIQHNAVTALSFAVGFAGGPNFVGFGNITTPASLIDAQLSDFTSASEYANFISRGHTQTFNGSIANLRNNQFLQNTYTSGSSPVYTNGATVYIQGAPIAGGTATFTNPMALWVQAGVSSFGGNVGIGTTSPTAVLMLKAGTATANTSPLKFTLPGVVLTTPELGVLETDANNLYYTETSLIRKSLSGTIFTQTADKSVTNTVTETSIVGTGTGYGLTLPTNFFVVGKTVRITMSGVYSTVAVTGDTVTIKVKYGSTVIASQATTSLLAGATNLFWWAEALVTCRSTGATGTVQISGSVRYQVASSAVVENELNNSVGTTTIDTTASSLLDVTVTHSAANASNTVKSLVGSFEILN